ncbi:response regulator [Lysinibacillus sp. BW-2-10]|uniref:response regulator n=1 Tax=Lysinibacillus sp. BW-2-10 TaxID=2590030 RepID=UPI00117F700A|nr:response regulator [Lysinibacillus sp. BW-2-10]TSI09667.1 response regulator [Lysinibacillus sp. BW-2-10]
MKVRTKLLLTLSSLPILLILLIVSGFSQTSYIDDSTEHIKTDFDSSVLAGQIRADLKDEGIIIRNLIIFKNDDMINKEMSKLQNERENIQANVLLLQENAKTPDQEELVNALKNTIETYEVYLDSVIAYVNLDNIGAAQNLMEKNADKLHEEITLVLRNITNGFDQQLENSLITLIKNLEQEIILSGIILGVCLLVIIVIFIKSIFSIFNRMSSMSKLMSDIANGKSDLYTKVEVIGNDEFDEIANSFNRMTETLESQMNREKDLTWINSNITDISTNLTGKHDLECLGSTLLSKLVPLVNSNQAVIYIKDIENANNQSFKYLSSYAFHEKSIKQLIRPSEGLIGQAIKEKQMLHVTEVPSNYLISSALGEAKPLNLVLLPIVFEDEVNAIIEISSFKSFSQVQLHFLEELASKLGIVVESVIGRIQLAKLLEESQTLMEEIQAQSEELQNQQEELRATNEELEEQTQALRQSEQKLQLQQVELEQTNAELEVKAKHLEEQNRKYEEANRIVEKAKAELEVKAEQLALSSKYKSEFLANMSHELRTPLNSLIILSKLLADNASRNLTAKQVRYAKTIYSSGNDLLVLINNILDLAKIESGKTEILPSEINISNIVDFVENNFKPIAENKRLVFQVNVKSNTPPIIFNDEVRIQQVLKNLLSNAFKFTDYGQVVLEISLDHTRTEKNGQQTLAFSVIDTGIGISKDKLDLIFEAFQQADGTTSRKFGGTGLGLSISRELATLLGGEIVVESEDGKGSKFTFYVGDYEAQHTKEVDIAYNEAAVTILEPKERENIQTELPNTNNQEKNSHIKRLLIVDDDLNQRNSIMELIGNMDFIIKAVSTGKEAIDLLKLDHFDCLILDLGLTDTSGFDLLAEIKNNPDHQKLKVFVYTGRDLSSKEEIELNKFAHTIIIKNEHSPERLVAELQLYLSESIHTTNDETSSQLEQIASMLDLLGKKILLVDDDVRNVFALSSVLEMAGVEVVFAENGVESLQMLEEHPDVDLILMDIMMPEMDGYEAITRIRTNTAYQQLPIIALTAKAMKEDREKCLAIGASDYVAKPVEPEQLLSIIKVWLY